MRHDEQERAAADHQHAPPWQDPVGLHEVLRAARREHAGQRPAREGQGPVIRSRGQDDGVGGDPRGLLLCRHGHCALIEDAPGHRARHDLHAERAHLVHEPAPLGLLLDGMRSGPSGEGRGQLAVVLPAELRVLVHQDHADAVPRGRPCRGQPGGAAAHHHARGRSHDCTPHSPSPRWISTRKPSFTGVMQARTLGRPSTVTRQSWQTPMPQK